LLDSLEIIYIITKVIIHIIIEEEIKINHLMLFLPLHNLIIVIKEDMVKKSRRIWSKSRRIWSK
jgi:hypothetical protein